MRTLRVVVVAFVLAVAAACGDDPDVSEDASAVLQERVAEIRTLAEARQADAVIAKIDELNALVEQLRTDGEISDEAADEILASIAAVRQNVTTITTTTTTTTTAPPPPPDDDEDEDKDDEEKGNEGRGNGDKGRGNGGDDD